MSIILSLIVFSVLVLIHEFGNFLLAKKNGIGVTEFSLGIGPRILSFVKGETRYSWKVIPFGGSCMMVGEDTDEISVNSFNSKSVWERISVVAAGPIFNFVLAFVLAIVYIGMQGYDEPRITAVGENVPAVEAGLKEGDVITEFNGKKIVIWRDYWLHNYLNPLDGNKVTIKYERDGKEYTTNVTPRQSYSMGISYYADDNKCVIQVGEGTPVYDAGIRSEDIIVSVDGNKVSSGKELNEYMEANPLDGSEIDITVLRDEKEENFKVTPKKAGYTLGMNVGTYVKASPIEVIRYSFTELRYDAEATWSGLKMLFTGNASKDDVSGPVGIVKIVGDSYEASKEEGFREVFLQIAYLIIILSVNLGIVNLLPFPALDGGRLVFLFIEAIRGKPIAKEKEAIVHFAGMILLMILMVVVLFNDITKLF